LFRRKDRNRKNKSVSANHQKMTQADFVKLIMPIKDKVFRLAKRLLVSNEEAEDATQEILMKLWNNKESIGEYRNVEAFSMTMTKNFCLDRLKSKQAQNLKIVHSNYQDNNTSLQRQVELNDSAYCVAIIIVELPEQQIIVLQLWDIEEYEFDEIAKVLDMNETAIRV